MPFSLPPNRPPVPCTARHQGPGQSMFRSKRRGLVVRKRRGCHASSCRCRLVRGGPVRWNLVCVSKCLRGVPSDGRSRRVRRGSCCRRGARPASLGPSRRRLGPSSRGMGRRPPLARGARLGARGMAPPRLGPWRRLGPSSPLASQLRLASSSLARAGLRVRLWIRPGLGRRIRILRLRLALPTRVDALGLGMATGSRLLLNLLVI